MVSQSQYSQGLDKNQANYTPLSPITFIQRAASVYPDNIAIIYGEHQQTWAETYQRCRQLGSALKNHGIGKEDTVAVMLPNIPSMVEINFGIPMAGAVINALNTRLDADAVAYMLRHSGAKLVIVDREYAATLDAALSQLTEKPIVIDVDDPAFSAVDHTAKTSDGRECGALCEYEDFLKTGDPEFDWLPADDEWQAIALGYTSGTTGDPKGVVTHHRGAYLNAMSNVLAWNMNAHPVYLWTLPLFHCNGWCFPWTVAALNGTNVCLRAVRADHIYELIKRHRVTHMCGAPIVLNLMANAEGSLKAGIHHQVNIMTAASAPPPAILEAMAEQNFNVTHSYGLTEVYGPAVVCSWHEEWNALPISEQAELKSRQGVRYPMLEELRVANPDTLEPVPNDGETIGEILFRGNIVMKGYLKNPAATEQAFSGGWFHSGDLAVCHEDGYVEIRDRSKDIIISGGENISSIEIEKTLYRHPAVLEAAVAAMPDEKWGESPCAFVTLHDNIGASSGEEEGEEEGEDSASIDEQNIINFCREHMAHFKAPRKVVFGPLPKTSTGKIQKYILRLQARELAS